MQVLAHIKGEQARVCIIDYIGRNKVTRVQLQESLSLTKQQVEHHLRRLQASGHIKKERVNNTTCFYTCTAKKFKPKDFTKELAKLEIKAGKIAKADILEEDLTDIQPTVPHARVIRLLKNPLPKAPISKNKRYGHGHGGIQSGMSLFGEL